MRKEIESLVDKYLSQEGEKPFSVPVSGKDFGREELINLIEASLEGWWTDGHWAAEFEKKLADYLGVKHVHTCNSGSSANLLAFSALCSPTLKERQVKKGSEVITLAAGFPTTINAIIQNECVPVFIDIEIPTYNVKISELERAYSENTKAVMIAHTLGNPFNVKAVMDFCQKHNLWLIEDNCDALGAEYNSKKTGSFGDIATHSFYPAHQITTAEGGAAVTNDPELSKIILSLRDWGRHCWCPTGKDNTCKNRFGWQLGDLPKGYDHKYTYGEMGYNLKMSDLHAAIGLAQIDRIDDFVQKRRENFDYLKKSLKELDSYFVLPEATENSRPSWFGFLLTINDKELNREDLLRYFQEKKIGTRLLFGGNITKQPYLNKRKDLYRIGSSLDNTDLIMENTFWLGVWPGLGKKKLDYIIEELKEYANTSANQRTAKI